MDDKIAVKADWDTKDMPRRRARFTLERSFTAEEMERLRRGHIPGEMEDKWFFYMEGNKLCAHRSWTGICIFIVEFGEGGRHRVTVNRDPKQYGNRSRAEDRRILTGLLNFWTQRVYDPYREWISETADALRKADGRN